MMTDLNASMMTDNMNIMTALYSTSRKIESFEIWAVLSIHWCTCEINSYKIMFLAAYSVTKEIYHYSKWDTSLAQSPGWICVRFFMSCGNRILKFEFSRIVCRGSRK